MEFEAWWLLAIPLFFGLGWFASRLDSRQQPRATGALPDAYFRGLNFLLNEQPDKAIDAFIDVVRLDPETLELHFALGNLFRRRGETDRAIRVHQNLAERPGLDPAQREHAMFELGQDYLRAGLLDRAEDAFNRLEGSRYAAQALMQRLSIAQMVRDWQLAIDLAARIQREGVGVPASEIAQYHCELAAQSLASSDPDRFDAVGRAIQTASQADARHPRPMLLRGELALAQGNAPAAIEAWRQLLRQQPAYAPLVAGGWLAAHRSLGRSQEALDDLRQAHDAHPGVDTMMAIAELLTITEGPGEALRWTEAQLRQQPSLLGLEKLLVLKQAALAPASASSQAGVASAANPELADIPIIRSLITPQARRLSRYLCAHCGFRARQFVWQCPGCSRWDTYAPRRGEELEAGR